MGLLATMKLENEGKFQVGSSFLINTLKRCPIGYHKTKQNLQGVTPVSFICLAELSTVELHWLPEGYFKKSSETMSHTERQDKVHHSTWDSGVTAYISLLGMPQQSTTNSVA